MPSTSAKQQRLMRAAAHDPAFADKAGVPVSVAKKFVAADKKAGTKFAAGGSIDGCASRGKTKGRVF